MANGDLVSLKRVSDFAHNHSITPIDKAKYPCGCVDFRWWQAPVGMRRAHRVALLSCAAYAAVAAASAEGAAAVEA